MTRKLIGYRIAARDGSYAVSQGREGRHDGYVMDALEAQDEIERRPDEGLLLRPIYEGDVQTPVRRSAMRRFIGYQLADARGVNIQGDEGDPSGLPSFHVMDALEAQQVVAEHSDLGLHLMPIYQGDVQNPSFSRTRRR